MAIFEAFKIVFFFRIEKEAFFSVFENFQVIFFVFYVEKMAFKFFNLYSFAELDERYQTM